MNPTRQLIQVGNSLGVTLPKDFTKSHNLKAGLKIPYRTIDGEISFSVRKRRVASYQTINDQEFVSLIKDVESRFGQALEKLAKLP